MKSLSIGLVIGVIVTLVTTNLWQSNRSEIDIGDNIKIQISDGPPGKKITIQREEEKLFSATVDCCGYILRVPSDYGYPEKVLYSEMPSHPKASFKLMSSRMTDEGIKIVDYNMDTGEVVNRMLADSATGSVKLYDHEAKEYLEIESEPFTGGNSDRSAASLPQ